MNARRELTVAVLACAAASGLVLFAASRGWGEVLTERVAPLPPSRTARTGAELAPWLPALGAVALAAAGALLATRGLVRRLLGGLLLLCGLGIAVASLVELGGDVKPLWPVVSALAAAVVAAVGGLTLRRGRSWPSLGTRYERPTPTKKKPATQAELWDALDRGEDPTA